MNPILFRIYFVIFAFTAQCFFGQNYSGGTSDGILKVNAANVPVKIFTTTENQDLSAFADRKDNKNVLVILNKSNLEHDSYTFNAAVLNRFKGEKYQFLDKDYNLINNDISEQNIESFKYIVKTEKPIAESDKIDLETKYKIWDPSTGIHLGPITLHFYSLMFICAFGLGYILMTRMFTIDHVNQKYVEPLFTWTLIGTILGARLGHVIFYQPELFKEDFWSVFLPISTKNGLKFTGFSGLASHGATIALILTTLYYSFKIIKKNPFWVYDRLGIVVSIGGAFVRIGNFFNSEIIGKPVDENSPFALLFPQQSSEYGITVPRYPTQLFEAFGYVCLFVLLWVLYRKTDKKYQQGWLFGLFFIILWAVRFFVEFLKEPQGDEFIQFAGLNTGQILSIPFMIAGLVIMIYSKNNKIAPEADKTF
ncbi:prolipoprotein diacylglyceryl transferase [Chryseobacterium sp. GMJ5]|uniref:Phosphatidylglycerol--prolipoprotein diacylglyceryl transferase n=1 Tax=Chryseobacterium gilvum TaxID=2976534 RepID=A0ABT2VTN3_9FLAO|nr:prolipoprotein diacylglyceryl transferase [Chryseobacterium gilvum]MCU7613357.1 prolipoprotein diacylglyceryl transferase [Chryseobacterium gilvum]